VLVAVDRARAAGGNALALGAATVEGEDGARERASHGRAQARASMRNTLLRLRALRRCGVALAELEPDGPCSMAKEGIPSRTPIRRPRPPSADRGNPLRRLSVALFAPPSRAVPRDGLRRSRPREPSPTASELARTTRPSAGDAIPRGRRYPGRTGNPSRRAASARRRSRQTSSRPSGASCDATRAAASCNASAASNV